MRGHIALSSHFETKLVQPIMSAVWDFITLKGW